jgi:hypothetical protein
LNDWRGKKQDNHISYEIWRKKFLPASFTLPR